ncbi:MAG: uroporphyrinogen decarboxylase family protein [Thermoproteota archaeon]
MPMLPLQRVLATFTQDHLDMIPVHHISFSSRVASYVLGREAYVGGGIQQWREAISLLDGREAHERFIEKSRKDAIELALKTEQDIVRFEYWRMNEKPCKKIDDLTLMFGDPDKSWEIRQLNLQTELFQIVAKSSMKEETFEDLEESVSDQEDSLKDFHPTRDDFEDVKAIAEQIGEEYALRVDGGSINIPYDSRTWLSAVVARPDLVSRLLDVQTEKAVRCMKPLSEVGAKLVFGGGDMASNDGPFYSPRSFHKLVLPRIRRIAEACHKYGMYYLFASDGNLWPIADDLFGRSGVDGYYEIDRRAGMDLGELRVRYPNLICIGNISSYILHRGSVEDAIVETKSCIEEAKRSGGIIVGVSNMITSETPKENVYAMLTTIKELRKMK